MKKLLLISVLIMGTLLSPARAKAEQVVGPAWFGFDLSQTINVNGAGLNPAGVSGSAIGALVFTNAACWFIRNQLGVLNAVVWARMAPGFQFAVFNPPAPPGTVPYNIYMNNMVAAGWKIRCSGITQDHGWFFAPGVGWVQNLPQQVLQTVFGSFFFVSANLMGLPGGPGNPLR